MCESPSLNLVSSSLESLFRLPTADDFLYVYFIASRYAIAAYYIWNAKMFGLLVVIRQDDQAGHRRSF